MTRTPYEMPAPAEPMTAAGLYREHTYAQTRAIRFAGTLANLAAAQEILDYDPYHGTKGDSNRFVIRPASDLSPDTWHIVHQQTGRVSHHLRVGDWIVVDAYGDFKVERDAFFRSRYEAAND